MDLPPVAITIRSFPRSGSVIKELESEFSVIFRNATGSRLSETEMIRALKDAEYVIAGTEPFSKKVLECCGNLKVISRVGVGTDSIDLQTASKRNILVLNTPEAPVISVSEHTLALLLAVMKRIPEYNNNVHGGNFSVKPGSLLYGKTVGIIGLGRIGYRFASILACMGCKIQFHDPFFTRHLSEDWTPVRDLEDLVRTSDIISLHAPPKQDGSPILTSALFKTCKKGMILINTARGALIDETALELALQEGIVASAGLDVFLQEPYSGSLLKYSQVIVTPHIASNTVESREQMETEAVGNLIRAKKRFIA
jgi:D-3-phosphoglycerate dehydrogenase / 2-oxoglutarate reductase